jgi:hypothetical protein
MAGLKVHASFYILKASLHHPIKKPLFGFAAYFLGLALGASVSTNSSNAKLFVLIPA